MTLPRAWFGDHARGVRFVSSLGVSDRPTFGSELRRDVVADALRDRSRIGERVPNCSLNVLRMFAQDTVPDQAVFDWRRPLEQGSISASLSASASSAWPLFYAVAVHVDGFEYAWRGLPSVGAGNLGVNRAGSIDSFSQPALVWNPRRVGNS